MRLSPAETLARDLDWNLLRVFLALAEAGSVTGAATRLGLKQPSVSQALKRLEDRVGHRLADAGVSRKRAQETPAFVIPHDRDRLHGNGGVEALDAKRESLHPAYGEDGQGENLMAAVGQTPIAPYTVANNLTFADLRAAYDTLGQQRTTGAGQGAGFIGSVVGAVVLLFIYTRVAGSGN